MYPRADTRKSPFNHFDSTFLDRLSLASPLTIAISHFSWAVQQGGKCSTHQRAPLPNQHTPATSTPLYHLTVIPLQGKIHVVPIRVSARHLRCAKYFFRALTLFFLSYFRGPPCSPLIGDGGGGLSRGRFRRDRR